MPGHIGIVDANGIVCRAFFGGPKDKTSADGQDVGAVSVFIEMLWSILGAEDLSELTHIAVVFDGGGRNHRHEIYPEYKANRGPKPDGLIDQIILCEVAASKMQLAVIRQPGEEADDIIATLAHTAKQQGFSATIISQDKDFLQMVDTGEPEISIFDPKRKTRLREADVLAEWGVAAWQMTDYQALCGDTADNIPGVKGIGDKTAEFLLREHGTLEAIYADTSRVNLKRGAKMKLNAGRENAFLSKKLVTLKRDVPLPDMLFDDMHIKHVQPGKELLDFLTSLGLPVLREKIAARIGYLEAAA